MSGVDALAAKLRTKKGVRYLVGVVVAMTDATHATVSVGSQVVTAGVPSDVGLVVPDQRVRLSVQDNVWTVAGLLSAGWVTAGFSAASGWSITAAAYRVTGGMVTVALEVVRTGSSVSVSSAGNFANINVLTVPAAILPSAWPTVEIPCLWRGTYGAGGGHMVPGTGVVSVDDWHSSGTLDNGNTLTALIVYPL